MNKKINSKVIRKPAFKEKKVRRKRNLKICAEEQGKCMNCYHTTDLTVHHIVFKSEGGDDSFGNLITLCQECHRYAHDGVYRGDKYVNARTFMIYLLKELDDSKYRKALKFLERNSRY